MREREREKAYLSLFQGLEHLRLDIIHGEFSELSCGLGLRVDGAGCRGARWDDDAGCRVQGVGWRV